MKKFLLAFFLASLYLFANVCFAFNYVENAYIDRPNYFKNPGFEEGRAGSVAYADAAGVVPVDGISGSPTVTRTLNGTTPIDGLKDLVITKDAANRQGEGVSAAFSIPSGLQSKAIEITFDYHT